MDLVNDLGKDLALAMLIEKKHSEKIDSEEIMSLLSKVREVLEPLSDKDHSQIIFTPITSEAVRSH